MEAKGKFQAIPVLLCYTIMSLSDLVGVSTSYIKGDFGLSETVAGFIPSMVFIWFLFLSIPSAMLMNRMGRKNTVLLSIGVSIIALLIPMIKYSFASCMAAFILLGIGNTILQVSLNPLLTNVVRGDKLTSSLTLGQVLKAAAAFLGPIVAAFCATSLGHWKYAFPILAAATLIAMLLLIFDPIEKEERPAAGAGLRDTFSLLSDKEILVLFLGIFFMVGADVGINTAGPKLMMERAGAAVEKAGYASSVYFICRTVGALLGALLLVKMNDIKYFRICAIGEAAVLAVLFAVMGGSGILVCVGLIGFFISSLFSVILSCALKARPEKANAISGLMITGVAGGAVVPPLMGALTDAIGNQCGSLIVISACMAYLIFCSFHQKVRS